MKITSAEEGVAAYRIPAHETATNASANTAKKGVIVIKVRAPPQSPQQILVLIIHSS